MTETNIPPHDQLIVVLGLQYAVLAKNVKGLKASIWAVDSVVIDWRRVGPRGDAYAATSIERTRTGTVE